MQPAVASAARSSGGPKLNRRIRTMIVDDSLTVRTVLSRTIEPQPDMEVVATAATAEQAIETLDSVPVDIVLLDLEMPGMGGLAALPMLLEKARGAPVMVVSSLTTQGAKHTLEALSMGAVDTFLKPNSGRFDEEYRAGLIDKIRALGPAAAEPAAATPARVLPRPTIREHARRPARILAIGGSTGGIHALCLLLKQLPRRTGIPILITQHLPAAFLPVFARQVELAASRAAVIAEGGSVLEPDKIVIAPGDGHLVIRDRGGRHVVAIDKSRSRSGCTPSADPMFEAVAAVFGDEGLGVVLSGMGTDGVEGAARLVEAGGTMLAQDRASSAVWGMPKAVAQAGLASAILPPERLAQAIAAKVHSATWK